MVKFAINNVKIFQALCRYSSRWLIQVFKKYWNYDNLLTSLGTKSAVVARIVLFIIFTSIVLLETLTLEARVANARTFLLCTRDI